MLATLLWSHLSAGLGGGVFLFFILFCLALARSSAARERAFNKSKLSEMGRRKAERQKRAR